MRNQFALTLPPVAPPDYGIDSTAIDKEFLRSVSVVYCLNISGSVVYRLNISGAVGVGTTAIDKEFLWWWVICIVSGPVCGIRRIEIDEVVRRLEESTSPPTTPYHPKLCRRVCRSILECQIFFQLQLLSGERHPLDQT